MSADISSSELFKKMDRDLAGYLFEQREENFEHATLSQEMAMFYLVKDGDIDGVKKSLKRRRGHDLPELSDSPLQTAKFLFVSVITSCCRFCIEGGMPSDESYGLSDLYIRRADRCSSPEEVSALSETMLLDYTERMRLLKEGVREYSPKITACLEYIDNHLHDRITVSTLSEELEINPSWLSTLFMKETGVSVSEYIRRKKLSAAKYLLSFDDYSCTDIAEYLGFSTSSHFTSLFKKEEGITPAEYRKKNYRKHFSSLS